VSSTHKDCLKCHLVPCIDLYRKIGEGKGGELYILELIRQKSIDLPPPCHSGTLLRVLCGVCHEIWELNNGSMPSLPLWLQGLRDLKASIFLLITGHYRASAAFLRSVIEMFIAGMYFDSKLLLIAEEASPEEIELKVKELAEEVDKFYREEYEVSEEEARELGVRVFRCPKCGFEGVRKPKHLDYGFALEWLCRKKVINGKLKNRFEKLINKLNGFIHSKKLEVWKPWCKDLCPAAVTHDPKEYMECVDYMQSAITLILKTLLNSRLARLYFEGDPLDNEFIQKVLAELLRFSALEKELSRQLIISNLLRGFLNEIKPHIPVEFYK